MALLVAPDADAQIIYTDLEPDGVTTLEGEDDITLDLDGDGTDDITLLVTPGGGENTAARVILGRADGEQELNGAFGVDAPYFSNEAFGSASLLSAGASISTFNGSFFPYGVMASIFSETPYYQFLNTEGFVGFRFVAGGGTTHFGWARVAVNENAEEATLLEYAFELTEEEPILAGATGVSNEADEALTGTNRISAVYPNPFADVATLKLEIARSQDVDVAVYNVLGQRVATITNTTLAAGFHEFDLSGRDLPNGLYVIRAQGTEFSETVRVTVAR